MRPSRSETRTEGNRSRGKSRNRKQAATTDEVKKEITREEDAKKLSKPDPALPQVSCSTAESMKAAPMLI